VKQLLKSGTISIDYLKSEQNLADPMTKPPREKTGFRNIEGNEA